MADDVKITMGADSTKAEAGVNRVKKQLKDLKNETKEGFFDLEGEKRVERNLGALASGLANARSAADVLAVSLDRVENVFKSSLGVGIAVSAITVVIGKFQEAQQAAENFKKSLWESVNASNNLLAQGQSELVSDRINDQMKIIDGEMERLKSAWSKGFDVMSRLNPLARLWGGGNGNDEEFERVSKALSEIDRLRTQARRDSDKKALDAAEKTQDEINGVILKETLQGIAERNEAEDKAAEDKKAKMAKMAYDAQEDERKWREQNAREMAEFEKDKADMAKNAAHEANEAAKKGAEMLAENQREMQQVIQRNEEKKAEIAREKFNKQFDDEIGMTPQERQFERQNKAYLERLDERAARRMANREQSASNGRMSDRERDDRARQLLELRKDAKAEKDPLQKTAQDIKDTLDKFLKNIGIK